jgi:hypothetical protein
MTGTTNSHGVWQVPPFEVLANAPRGLESIVKVASVDGASQSKRGVFEDTDEQLASARPNTTATNPAVLITSVLLLAEPNTIHGPRDLAQAYQRLAVVEPRTARGNREPELAAGRPLPAMLPFVHLPALQADVVRRTGHSSCGGF